MVAPRKHKKAEVDSSSNNTRILNEGKIQEWIKADDVYKKYIRSCIYLNERPKVNNSPICHRFHSRGYCFENYNNISSHIDNDKLDDKTKAAVHRHLVLSYIIH